MHWFIFLNILITINALETRVFNGNVSRPGEHGYLVKLHIDSKNNRYVCSGSIIGARWILTSAHCLPNGVNVINVFRKTGTGRKLRLISISSDNMITHPDYIQHNQSVTNKEVDIALLKTTKAIPQNKRVWAIKLARSSPSIGQSAVLAGYGVSEAKDLVARDGIVHISKCPYNVSHLLCTYDKVRAGDADSGGALILEDRLVGVTSASCVDADRLDVPNCLTAYANVAAHYNWINKWMNMPDN